MLKLRILTAIVLLAPLLAALFLLPSIWIAVIFGVVVTAGAWEWTALIGIRSVAQRGVYTGLLLAAGFSLMAAGYNAAMLVFVVATAGWLLALVELVRRPRVHDGWLGGRDAHAVAGFLILVPSWLATYSLHAADPDRPLVLLYALVLVWVADSMAYLSGHLFGRTKLAPAISPGKTVEGVVGGVLSVALVAGVGGTLIWHYTEKNLALWIALSIIAALISVLGDLLESKFKRMAGVKDSGRMLPGHGGVLDRIDALTAALPVFALGWHLWFRPA